ncbi:MAG: DUF1453 family protein [Candidatus Eremiobacteraeota bacterium]|nr:DUF1453 family protein [Candidatus Eremiobacteraeota bacterium]
MAGPQSSQLVYVVIIVLVVARFLFRELRERKLRLRSLFVLPAIVGVIGVLLAVVTAMQMLMLPVLALSIFAALVVGTAIGLAVARYTTLRVGPPGFVFVRGSAATVAIWLGALALRAAARLAVGSHAVETLMIANTALVIMLATALGVVRYRVLSDARTASARSVTTEMRAL